MSFAGIDIGGTFIKAALFSNSGEPVRVARQPIPGFLSVDGPEREIDPDSLFNVVMDALATVINGHDSPIRGLLVTGQMAGLAFVDQAGRAKAPLVTWQDSRVDRVSEVRAALGETSLARLGDGLRVGMPLVTLTGIAIPEKSSVTSLLAFVAGKFAGTRANVVHTTDAASWGLLDIASGSWDRTAIMVAGLTPESLPDVSRWIVPIGLSSMLNAPVYCAVGDQQASLVGSMLEPGEVSINIATGCQVSMITHTPHSPAQLRPYFGDQFLRTVTHLPAGRLLTQAVASVVGTSPTQEQWEWASMAVSAGEVSARPILEAANRIADSCVEAAKRLGAEHASRIKFSGGIAQGFPPIRTRIVERLNLDFCVFDGDDSALAGLGVLAKDLRG